MDTWRASKLRLKNFARARVFFFLPSLQDEIFIAPLPFQQKTFKTMWKLNRILLAAVGAWAFWTIFSSSFNVSKISYLKDENILQNAFFDENIGLGPFGLNQRRTLGPIPELAKNLIVLGYNHRPDVKEEERVLLLCLADSLEKRLVTNGEKVFLFEDKEKKFHFSFAPNTLYFVPLIKDRDVVHIEVQDKGRFALLPAFKGEGGEKAEFIESLKRGTVLGKDLLLQNYGGKEYQFLTKKHKIDLGSQVLFVEEGDFLCLREGQWAILEKEESAQFLPLAKIKTITSQGMGLDVWDETGFSVSSVNMGLQQSPKMGYKVEELFSKVKIKSSSELSCLMGKRRVILRQGDWWLKTEMGWRKLNNLHDIEEYLNHRMRGDLFIFDTVEVVKEKAILKGKFFDQTRTQMSPLLVQTALDKKGSWPEKKKNKIKDKKVGRR